jgi:hypothetical protein
MKVVTISDYFFFAFFLDYRSRFFLLFFSLFKSLLKPQKKDFFLYVVHVFFISFHLFAFWIAKETHQKDLTNILFNFLFISYIHVESFLFFICRYRHSELGGRSYWMMVCLKDGNHGGNG